MWHGGDIVALADERASNREHKDFHSICLKKRRVYSRSQVIEEPGYVNLIEGAAHRVPSCVRSANAFIIP